MSRHRLDTYQHGISLVELIIVIAISGLFLAVVLAVLPRAQISRRDSQRKAYLLRVAANVDKYKDAASNHYQYPSAAAFPIDFGGGGQYNVNDNDPLSGTQYTFSGVTTPSSGTAAGIGYVRGQSCSSPGSGFYSLTIGLESDPNFYCIDNH